ncbi:MAG TPA: ATP-dependent metallopeptidase FtsH/Yme1/Tma family protein, partial [Paludibacter sp.]|nr:ATP-dependent metallopeptidase FtsH/Yme1/Tma family protein [Paludibacter sp.]
MENKTPNPNPLKPAGKSPKFNISWIYGIIIFTLMGLFFFGENTPSKEVPFTTFKDYVLRGMIEKVDVYSSKNLIEAQLINYTKTPVDSVFLQRAFGNNY